MSGVLPASGRLTYNLGNDRTGSPVFLAQGGNGWWKLKRVGSAPVEVELSIEQIRMIVQVTGA